MLLKGRQLRRGDLLLGLLWMHVLHHLMRNLHRSWLLIRLRRLRQRHLRNLRGKSKVLQFPPDWGVPPGRHHRRLTVGGAIYIN